MERAPSEGSAERYAPPDRSLGGLARTPSVCEEVPTAPSCGQSAGRRIRLDRLEPASTPSAIATIVDSVATRDADAAASPPSTSATPTSPSAPGTSSQNAGREADERRGSGRLARDERGDRGHDQRADEGREHAAQRARSPSTCAE